MLSPTPFSLCCTLFLSVPLYFFFSSTSNGPLFAIFSIYSSNSTISGTSRRSTAVILLPNSTSSSSSSSNSSTSTRSGGKNSTAATLLSRADKKSKDPTFNVSAPAEEDEDLALFRLASLTRPNATGGPKKIAFLFLTTGPLPFASLWDLFFRSFKSQNESQHLFNIYIHADPSLKYVPSFSGVFANRTIPSKPTRRSDPTLIAAARRLLANALLDDPSNAMFALFSPSCIPLHSFSFVYRTLTNYSTKSFIEILNHEPTLWSRYSARGEDTMLPEVPFESFRVGSQFFVLARRHARLVVRDTRLWKKFRLPCQMAATCYPEEHYFPTLLSMQEPGKCIPATLTHVDWRGSMGGHPRTYGPDEVGPELIHQLRSTRPRYGDDGSENKSRTDDYPFLFARKFSPACLEPLKKIASDVIFGE